MMPESCTIQLPISGIWLSQHHRAISNRSSEAKETRVAMNALPVDRADHFI